MKLYWAYGSNLSKRQMARRCPAAVPLEALTVENLVLRFRGVADVGYLTGAFAEGALWAITPECEKALDTYEGVAPGNVGGLYRKCYFDYLDPDSGETHKVLYYKMNRSGIMPPGESYLDGIIEGYADFGIDTRRLVKAVEHSWRRKDSHGINGFMSYRWQKAGKPKMARPDRVALVYEGTELSEQGPPPVTRNDLDPSEQPPPFKLFKREKLPRLKDEPLPDVCLRTDPDNPNWSRAVVLSDKAEDYFAENIKAKKLDTEWQFRFSTHVVAGLLQKKRLLVAILEKLKR